MLGRQSGLGRGLGALIPQKAPVADITPPASAHTGDFDLRGETLIKAIPVDSIDPNPHQPRSHFDHGDLEDLVNSIKEHGILQPIVVTPQGSRYELIAGERRLRAAKIAGLTTIPALVRKATEQQKMELALIENVQRSDLNPIEEAYAYLRLQEEFGLTQDEVGTRLGKSRPQIANTIRLLQLPQEIQRALAEKKISASNARTLLSFATDEERMEMFKALLSGNFTVRQTEARVSRTHHPKTVDPNLADLEDRLRNFLGAKVKIRRDARGEGEVRIQFFDEDGLKEIVNKIV